MFEDKRGAVRFHVFYVFRLFVFFSFFFGHFTIPVRRIILVDCGFKPRGRGD